MKLTEHFDLDEFECHDGTQVPSKYLANVTKLAKALEVIREALGGKPITIASGYRTKEWNDSHDGAPSSKHLTAEAADIVVYKTSPSAVRACIEDLIAKGKIPQGGIGAYKTFTHYDPRGTKARW